MGPPVSAALVSLVVTAALHPGPVLVLVRQVEIAVTHLRLLRFGIRVFLRLTPGPLALVLAEGVVVGGVDGGVVRLPRVVG